MIRKSETGYYYDIRSVRAGTSVHPKSPTIPLVARSLGIFRKGLLHIQKARERERESGGVQENDKLKHSLSRLEKGRTSFN